MSVIKLPLADISALYSLITSDSPSLGSYHYIQGSFSLVDYMASCLVYRSTGVYIYLIDLKNLTILESLYLGDVPLSLIYPSGKDQYIYIVRSVQDKSISPPINFLTISNTGFHIGNKPLF